MLYRILVRVLYLLGFTTVDARLEEIRLTLLRCWQYAPYIRRVSDFGRFCKYSSTIDSRSIARFAEKSYHAINDLDHTQSGFLLVARIYQGWSYRALHLAPASRK